MSYLAKFPTIEYKGHTLTDITRKVIIHDEIKNNASLWVTYPVKDGELPEDIAFNFYGSAEYVDIILLMNDIIDPFYGWVLPIDTLDEVVKDRYGNALTATHHYEKDGIVVHHTTQGATPVSNYDHEFRENEKKRRIRILKPEYLNKVIDEMDIKLHQKRRDSEWLR